MSWNPTAVKWAVKPGDEWDAAMIVEDNFDFRSTGGAICTPIVDGCGQVDESQTDLKIAEHIVAMHNAWLDSQVLND